MPPVDSLDVWPLLAGQATASPRHELPLGKTALISDKWKLLLGSQQGAAWHGPDYPNASSTGEEPVLQCGKQGCLFDVAADPTEHEDVRDRHPEVAAELSERLQALAASFFDNNDRGVDSCPKGIEMPCACWMAVNFYGGFFGPYQEVDRTSRAAEKTAADAPELVV
uniref:Sulfatase N-terminal domain-containing protein n=1 Tax=Alexandrium catenella TaxID=2925 RepID=A0A7S1L457_ALECA